MIGIQYSGIHKRLTSIDSYPDFHVIKIFNVMNWLSSKMTVAVRYTNACARS